MVIYKCLDCNTELKVTDRRAQMRDGMTCAVCDGRRFVAGQERITEIAEAAKEHLIKNNLLIIALEDETSVPKVFYKGEEVLFKKRISIDWETDTEDEESGGLTYAVEHQEKADYPVTNLIERRVKSHALY